MVVLKIHFIVSSGVEIHARPRGVKIMADN